MKFKVSYAITGTFDIDVPDENVTDLLSAITFSKEMLKDNLFQLGVVKAGRDKKVMIKDIKLLGDENYAKKSLAKSRR